MREKFSHSEQELWTLMMKVEGETFVSMPTLSATLSVSFDLSNVPPLPTAPAMEV